MCVRCSGFWGSAHNHWPQNTKDLRVWRETYRRLMLLSAKKVDQKDVCTDDHIQLFLHTAEKVNHRQELRGYSDRDSRLMSFTCFNLAAD